MRSRGMGVVGTVVTLGILVLVGFAALRLAGPHFRKARMEKGITELLDREFRAGDEALVAAVVDLGARDGLAIAPEEVSVSREGKRIGVTVTIPDEADLVVAKVPSSSTITIEREVSWALGVIENTQDKVDRVNRQQKDRFSNAPVE